MGWFVGLLIGMILTFVIIIILANVYPPPVPVCGMPGQGPSPGISSTGTVPSPSPGISVP